jgi:hypothetical protein
LIDETFVDNLSRGENNTDELNIEEFNMDSFIDVKIETNDDVKFLDSIITDKHKKVPTNYIVSFKTFVVFSNDNYNKDLFYKMFTNIYINIRNKEIGVDDLEDLVVKTVLNCIKDKDVGIFELLKMIPGFEEIETFETLENLQIDQDIFSGFPRVIHLYALCKILKAHILVFGRVKKPYTQNFRCIYPLLEKDDDRDKYIILNQSNLGDGVDKFEVVGKKLGKGKLDYKYIFNQSDFSEVAFNEIKKRCTVYLY